MNELEFMNKLSYDFRQITNDRQINLQYIIPDIGNAYFYIHTRGRANFLLRKKYQKIIFGNDVKNWEKSDDFIKNKKLRRQIKKANTSWSAIKKHNDDLISSYGQPIKTNRKWRKNVKSSDMNWNGFYLVNKQQLKQQLYDKINDQPLYLNKKQAKNSLFAKHITLKQSLQNFGFQELKILDGNIAYLKMTSFPNPNYIDKEIVNYVIGFMAHAEAVILDLQNVKEGDINFLPLFCSYFLPKNTTQLISTQYCRYLNKYQPLNTHKKLPKNSFVLDKQPLYIIVNQQTAATAELLTYFLKKHRKATIIGQITAGATHIVRRHTIHANLLYVDIPDTEIIVNQADNWKNKGIKPDSIVNEKIAFESAYQQSLQNLLDSTETTVAKSVVELLLNYQKSKNNQIVVKELDEDFFEKDSDSLQIAKLQAHEIFIRDTTKYMGKYEFEKTIFFENGCFFFKNYDLEPVKLLPITETLFMLEDATKFDLAPLHYFAPYTGSKDKVCYLRFIFNKNKASEISLIFLDKRQYKLKKI